MIHIRTGSRLHFGLLSVPSQAAGTSRQFGGVGLMIDQPGITLSAELSETWSADGPLAARAVAFGQRYHAAVGIRACLRMRIESAAAEHAGLGTGTQLGLAVARASVELTGQPIRDAASLALAVDRGGRSAIGAYGFDLGGLLVEGGKLAETRISPLLVRHAFPEDWRIILITPAGLEGTHGRREVEAFTNLASRARDERITESLCRLVLLALLPALLEKDEAAFGEALFEFNRRSGEMFKSAQGGVYAHPRIEAIVEFLRQNGIRGVGQSSWGPTVFAITLAERANALREFLIGKLGCSGEEIIVTAARNQGAVVTMGD
jgi:beta-ribofuranosylaminobenzene 5'-phosphate synthase